MAASTGAPGPASAEGSNPPILVRDIVMKPGQFWNADAAITYANLDGTIVYAFSTTPLNSTSSPGAGLPAGLTFGQQSTGCRPAAQITAVYLCKVVGTSGHASPRVTVSPQTVDNTTGYYGAVYAPSGSDLTTAIQRAQTAAATPADSTHGAGTFTVKTPEHVAQNTLAFNAPAIRAAGSTEHTLHVHAVDGGHLELSFGEAPGQIDWGGHDVGIRVSAVTAGNAAQCTHTDATVDQYSVVVTCNLTPGDTDVTYALTVPSGTENWRMTAHARYQVYSWGTGYLTADASFAVTGGVPVRDRHRLLGRDNSGRLWQYVGTNKTTAPFHTRSSIGDGWQGYTALTKLSTLALDNAAGDLVARDKSGVLWYYRGEAAKPFAPRTRVGAGWNIYTMITGAGDLTGDSRADLVGRDSAGTLWLYQGTGKPNAPFSARTRIGPGWNMFNSLAGGSDLTGDGKPDLVTRDTTGNLWLYRGTGKAAVPFVARTRVGPGWNIFNQLVLTGDLTGDGKADLVARDSAGNLWLYQGTNNPSAPFSVRTQIGPGWNMFNSLI
ncbi:FG-GAP repeat domain-containing protein [Actinacidiphila alni]|uniref:FG-GAP repeat domain-containing protein n=1 Tax=Actinacidiphila alni TaxID=380248 RepID=UPI0034530804